MSNNVTVTVFLSQMVDGYLLSDLDVMVQTQPRSAMGHLGFPIVSACCGGIELLGALASSNPYNKMAGAEYFRSYWVDYLYPQSQRSALALPFYSLLRHGLAHCFVTKPSVIVTKYEPTRHLTMDQGTFVVDSTALAVDFKDSYRVFKQRLPHLSAQDRLDEMFGAWSSDVTRFQQALSSAGAVAGPNVLSGAGWQQTPSSLPTTSVTSVAPSGTGFIQPQAPPGSIPVLQKGEDIN